jgi:hypothetical protein
MSQAGYTAPLAALSDSGTMLDLLLAAPDLAAWHHQNRRMNPSHYSLLTRYLPLWALAALNRAAPGVLFNTDNVIPLPGTKGVRVKYGVVELDALMDDLSCWRSLYCSGRMHKPLLVLRENERVEASQTSNLVQAVRYAVLVRALSQPLPNESSGGAARVPLRDLFVTLCALSYAGDPRMDLGAENPRKVQNIVDGSLSHFHALYQRPLRSLFADARTPDDAPVLRLDEDAQVLHVHATEQLIASLLIGLPQALRDELMQRTPGSRPSDLSAVARRLEERSTVEWARQLSSRRAECLAALHASTAALVRRSARMMAVKGLLSTRLSTTLRYARSKRAKAKKA